jgi:hypothetical protein
LDELPNIRISYSAKETGRAVMLKTLSFDVTAGSWTLQENFSLISE